MNGTRGLGFGPCIESFLLRGSAGGKEIAGPGHSGVVQDGRSCSAQFAGMAPVKERGPQLSRGRGRVSDGSGVKTFSSLLLSSLHSLLNLKNL